MADLDEILTGDQPRDELGRFASTSAQPDAPPASPTTDAAPPPASIPEQPPSAPPSAVAPTPAPVAAPEPSIPPAALQDERRKRQQYERETAELRRKLEQYEQRQQAQPELPADFWENPQAFISAAEQRAIDRALQQSDERMRNQFFNLCEIAARGRYTDYDTVTSTFLDRVQDDPVLRAELARASDPAEFAYKTGKRLQEFSEMGDPQTYRQKLEAEIRQKVEAEWKARTAAQPAIPQSLNAETSAPSVDMPAGRTPMDSFLGKHFV